MLARTRNRPILSVSIGLVLLLVLLCLTLVPILLLRGSVSSMASKAVEQEAGRLVRGILDFSRESLLAQFERVQEVFLRVSSQVRTLPPPEAGDSYTLAFGGARIGNPLLYLPGEGVYLLEAGPKASSVDRVSYTVRYHEQHANTSNTETLSILLEGQSAMLWIGVLPFLTDREPRLWAVGKVVWGGTKGLLALPIEEEFLAVWFQRLEDHSHSRVYLVTADNVVLNDGNPAYFSQSYAHRALSRIRAGEFISFSSTEHARDVPPSEVMVQAWADPNYLFNLVTVTPMAALRGSIDKVIDQTTLQMGVVALVLGSIALLMVLILWRYLHHVHHILELIARGNFNPRRWRGRIFLKELVILEDGIYSMAHILKNTMASLKNAQEGLEHRVEERTKELADSLGALKDARDVLIQHEKMAALGRTVAAFTHEVNNPLGVSVTGISKVLETARQLMKAYTDKTLGEKSFQGGLGLIIEAAELVERSLVQASRITGSFKNISVDQSRNEVRTYQLKSYIGEIIGSLHGYLRNRAYRLDWFMSEDVQVRGNPATMYQILSNLVANSVRHGFEGSESGQITIVIDPWEGRQVRLVYRDDGHGMGVEQLNRLYEPFYTTRRQQGGTGLGMHVVYTSVVNELGGSITCQSHPGEGVEFTIIFPMDREGTQS